MQQSSKNATTTDRDLRKSDLRGVFVGRECNMSVDLSSASHIVAERRAEAGRQTAAESADSNIADSNQMTDDFEEDCDAAC
jgi:hypothetical protein